MFKKKTAIKIGLDLGSSSIKIVRMAYYDKGFVIQNFILKDIPRSNENISSLLKDSLDELKASNTAINISLSGQNVITRYVTLPVMSKDEFKKALKFEVHKYMPFSIEEVNYDGYILRQDLPDNKMLVLIAAAKKDFLSERLKLIQDLGLNVGIVDIDSLALINAFNFSYSQDETLAHKTIALLNIGAAITNVNILEAGKPCLSRDINIAGDNFTNKIADELGVDVKTAKDLKTTQEKEALNKIKPSIDTVLSQLANEVRSSFDYYESQSVTSVEKIFVSGGGSLLSGLVDNLSHLLGVEIQTWDALKNFEYADGLNIEKIKAKSAQLAVAVGLAMR